MNYLWPVDLASLACNRCCNRYRYGTGLTINMGVGHFGTGTSLPDTFVEVISKVCPDGRGPHRSTVAARAHAAKHRRGNDSPFFTITDSPQHPVGGAAISPPRLVAVASGEN